MKKSKPIIHKIGSAAVKTGIVVGGTIIENYKKIDPDVIRHIVQVPLLSYSLFVSRHEKIDPGKPDGHPPLIFVHGLGGNRGNFLLMSWYLWLLGRKRSYKIHFDAGQSMQDMTTALARFIQEVLKVTGQHQVEIVAHSFGGLVARMAIKKYRLSHHVKTLITLGSPHHGTYSARYANTALTRDIRPNSKLIKELEKQPWPKGVRGVTFWSRSDILIIPPESAAMDGTTQVEITPFTHYSYLIDPKSWAAVQRALENG